MLRKWIVPLASLALLAGFGTGARAAEDPKPAGKATITVKVVDGDGKVVDGATVNLTMPPARKRGGRGGATPATPATPTSPGTPAPKMAEDPKPAADPATPATPATPAKPKRERVAPLQTATSDADGAVTFKDVADGTYVVQARLKAAGNGRERVVVTDGKDVSVTVTIKQKGA